MESFSCAQTIHGTSTRLLWRTVRELCHRRSTTISIPIHENSLQVLYAARPSACFAAFHRLFTFHFVCAFLQRFAASKKSPRTVLSDSLNVSNYTLMCLCVEEERKPRNLFACWASSSRKESFLGKDFLFVCVFCLFLLC